MGSISFSIYNVILLFGVFQALLLASIFLFNKNYRKKANYALTIVLLFMALMSLGNVFQSIELDLHYPITKYIPFFNTLLLPFGLYFFVVFLMEPKYEFRKVDAIFLIAVVIQLVFNIGLFLTYLIAPTVIESFDEARYIYYRFSEFVMLICWILVIIFSLKKVSLYHQQLLANFSEIEGKSLYWLRNVMLLSLGLWGIIFFSQSYLLLYHSLHPLFYIAMLSASLIVYWLGYFIILRRDIFEIPTFKNTSEPEALKPTLSDKTDEHYQNLLNLMQKEKLYQDAQLNMDTLAEKTALSNGYLSKIINQKENKNFYDFVNAYRIAEVKSHLNNPNYAHYSILGIGLEAGFKSKSTFNAVFKKMTGMTPSEYKRGL